MKIAHFLYDSPRNPWLGGGGAIRAQEINSRLVQMGHEVHMICGGFPGFSNQDWQEEGVYWHSCASLNQYAFSRLWYSWQCRSRFSKLSKSMAFDLVVNDISAFAWAFPWRVWSGPFVGIVHHIVGEHAQRKIPLLGQGIAKLERWNIQKHQNLITVSQGTQGQLQKLAKLSHIQVIYNGIPHFANFTRQPPQPYFLFLGRIDRYNKGLDLLLEAFAQFALAHPTWNLILAGVGKDTPWLEQTVARMACAKQVQYLGKVSEAKKQELLQNTYALCMPSRFEGWGITAVEAASLGCPVLATDISGLSEAVQHQKTGLLVPPDHSSALLQVMEQLEKSPDLRQQLSLQGPAWAKQFSWDEIAQAQCQLYQKVCHRE